MNWTIVQSKQTLLLDVYVCKCKRMHTHSYLFDACNSMEKESLSKEKLASVLLSHCQFPPNT